jgi:DNA (cytosine-5)-methyltransferase 1
MQMVESNLTDGWKQSWVFTKEYDHLDGHSERPKLEKPRRLTWKECAALQTFPKDFEPVGSLLSKYKQIGNAVPPTLMEVIVRGIADGSGLQRPPPIDV